MRSPYLPCDRPARLARMLVLLPVLILSACKGDPTGVLPSSVGALGSQPGGGPMAPPAGGSTVDVAIQDFSYAPATITVKVGTTVRWTNNGPSAHTTTSDAAVWASQLLSPPPGSGSGMGDAGMGSSGMGSSGMDGGAMSASGASFQFTFARPGTYPYHCTMHPPGQLSRLSRRRHRHPLARPEAKHGRSLGPYRAGELRFWSLTEPQAATKPIPLL